MSCVRLLLICPIISAQAQGYGKFALYWYFQCVWLRACQFCCCFLCIGQRVCCCYLCFPMLSGPCSNVFVSMCATCIVFSNVLDSVLCSFIGFPNVSVSQKQQTLEKPITTLKTMATMVFKLYRPDGVTPADSLKVMVSFYGFFLIVFFQCCWLILLLLFPMFWAPCVPRVLVFQCFGLRLC